MCNLYQNAILKVYFLCEKYYTQKMLTNFVEFRNKMAREEEDDDEEEEKNEKHMIESLNRHAPVYKFSLIKIFINKIHSSMMLFRVSYNIMF